MEVLFDEAKVDVFAVTESRLESTILSDMSVWICLLQEGSKWKWR